MSRPEWIYYRFVRAYKRYQEQEQEQQPRMTRIEIREALPEDWKEAFDIVMNANRNATEAITIALVKWLQFGEKLHNEEVLRQQNLGETEYDAKRKVAVTVMGYGITKESIFKARKIWRCLCDVPIDIVVHVRCVSPRILRCLSVEEIDKLREMLRGICSNVSKVDA
jgi:hypothetical protein